MLEQTEGFRLSSQQRRLWLLSQGGPVYTTLCAFRLRGALDEGRLFEAARQLFARHEILRTTFRRPPGVRLPLQTVAERGEPLWLREDMSGASAPALEAIYERERRADFDLEAGPLVRLTLVRLSAGEHVLVVCAPALNADALTLRHVASELLSHYRGEGDAGDGPSQYADFAEWQSDAGGDERAARGRAFWANKDLSGLATVKLPYAEQPPAGPVFEPRVLRAAVSAETAALLAEQAARLGTSEDCFLLACWQVLLWRLTAHCEVTVGVAFDGRGLAELRGALGPFARFVPVSLQLGGGLALGEVVEQADAAVREAGELQDYFSWDETAGEGDPAQSFAPACFEYVDWPDEEAGGLSVSLESLHACPDRFRLKLSCVRAGGRLAVELHYDPRAFPAGVERTAGHFAALLAGAASDPSAPIARLPLIGEFERRRLLDEYGRGGHAEGEGLCAHRLFEGQAARTPDAPAVAFEEELLTYAALNARANRLAHYLRAGGVGPEVRVGICVERSAEMIVALLAVLKAGGAYVPLEPSHPRERTGMMLDDAGAAVLLTETGLLAGLPAHGARVVCLDEEPFAGMPASNPESGVGPGNLAYVIFTSGSTGRPKGVAIEHRQLCNYVAGVSRRLDLPAGASYAVVSTFSADLGNTVIFPSLCRGGCLHVVSHERATDPESFAEYAERAGIDCLKIVPSHFESLLTATRQERAVPLRRLILGGETSRWEFVRLVEGLAPGCEVYNHYGPTETTVGVTTYRVEAGAEARGAAGVPLGRPLPGTRIHLLDPGRGLMPEGLAGELCITGAGLARGYLSRPDLTAERFVPDPYAQEPGARLYPTGDLARHLPGGDLEFLGRADGQVKFHGHRVELGEIRQALRRHPQVRDAVVVVARDEGGSGVIIAYYVSKQELEVATLRDFVSETVIRETVPNYFVHIKRLPLTLNGKINYRALPSLEDAKQQSRRPFVEPRNATEAAIAAIWAHLLGVERVSVDDNFFELGGHSLLATRIVSRLRRELEVEVPLQSLFESPTVAGLAAAIGARSAAAEAATEAPAVAPAPAGRSTADQLNDLSLISEEEARALLEAEARL